MRRMLLMLGLCSVLVVGATPVLATSPVTLTITGATLTARVQVTVSFDVVCQPITDFINTDVINATMGAAISVDQASGRAIAHASGGDVMPPGPPNVICDGITVNHESVSAISSTVPFHGGPAVAGVSVDIDDPGCIFCGGSEFGSVQAKVNLK